MKKQLTLGEGLGFALTITIVFITAWISNANNVSRQDERIKILEQSREEVKSDIKEIKKSQQDNFVFISSRLETILLKLENKQDKK